MSDFTREQLTDIAFEKYHMVEMMFDPKNWETELPSSHDWKTIKFPPNPRKLIPKKPGVYIFVINPAKMFEFRTAAGLFYIGKATNLYERIGPYISEIDKDLNKSRRPHIWKMVNAWNNHLFYHFTTCTSVNEAEELESRMISCLRPPFNKEIDAEASKRQRAF